MEKFIGVWFDNHSGGKIVGYLKDYQDMGHLRLLAKFDDYAPAYAYAANTDEDGIYVGNPIPCAGEKTDDGFFQVTKVHRNDIFDYLEYEHGVDEDEILADFSVSEDFLRLVAERVADALTGDGLYWDTIETCLDDEYPEFMARVRGE